MLEKYFNKKTSSSGCEANGAVSNGYSQCNEGCKICVLESFVHPDWRSVLQSETSGEYFKNIKKVLHSTAIFYPPVEKIFNFTHLTDFATIKVVILGQDPYHNPGQAMGLSFSVSKTARIPPSLVNIFKELSSDIPGFVAPKHGDLTGWARQGVLLLNDTLTVAKNSPASHSDIGWKNFTRKIVEKINDDLQNVVFILWGSHAREKARMIDRSKHLVLESGHPSPFSVKTFQGCKHFSKANEYLQEHSKEPVNWAKL